MFSPELMRFIINYQMPEYKKDLNKKVKNFKFKPKNRILAHVFLLNKW